MATRKTKRRAPSNASPKNTSMPGATGTQMPQSDPTKKPFTPEVLDRTVIAIPLLDQIKKDGETKLQPIIIDLNLDYHGGREAARAQAQKLVKDIIADLGLDPKQQNVNDVLAASPSRITKAPPGTGDFFGASAAEADMDKDVTIGLVVPFAVDEVPDEGLQMYPDVRFVQRGDGVRSLTPGLRPAPGRVSSRRRTPRREGRRRRRGDRNVFHVSAALISTTNCCGPHPDRTAGQHHEPVVVDGAAGRSRCPADHGGDGLCGRGEHPAPGGFSRAQGFEVLGLEGFGLLGFGEPGQDGEADIIALGSKLCAAAPDAEGLLISCGGLRTLGVARPLEERHRVPVVSSTQAAFLGGDAACGRKRPRRRARHAAGTVGRRPCALRRIGLRSAGREASRRPARS